MRHFQHFDKVDSFLQNSRQLNCRGGEGVIKEGTGILHQIYRLKGVLIVWGIVFIKVRVGII